MNFSVSRTVRLAQQHREKPLRDSQGLGSGTGESVSTISFLGELTWLSKPPP